MKNRKRNSRETSVKSSPKKSPKKADLSIRNSAGDGDVKFGEAAAQENENITRGEDSSADELNDTHHLEEGNHIELIQNVKSTFSVEDLTSDDEVYTFQCPEDFVKQNLCNKNLDFSQIKTLVSSKNQTFQVQLLKSDKNSITLAVPKKTSGGSLINLPLKGHIVIHKVVDVPCNESMAVDDCDKHAIVFPNDIKVRHPLLGIDWKAHVDLANAALKNDSSHKKKSKKIKKEKFEDGNKMEIKNLKRENSEPEIVVHKKKKRKKDL